MSTPDTLAKKRRFQLPHTMTILFVILVIAAVATYIAPTGAYDTMINEAGSEVLDPNSFHAIARTPISLTDFMLAIPKGLNNTAPIIFMVLLSLAGIELLNESKAINAGILSFIKRYKNLDLPLMVAMAIIFGCIAGFAGWNIEFVPFIPIVVSVVRAMGYDDILGISIVVFPAAGGWSSGIFNVFSTAILHGLADLPLFSGWEYRLVSFIVFMAISLAFIILYALRSKKKRREAESAGTLEPEEGHEAVAFTTRRKITLVFAIFAIGLLTYGAIALGWGLSHVGGFWVLAGLIIGLINGYEINKIIAVFIRGLQSIVAVTILIGMASAVLIILEQGSLMHSIIHGLAGILSHMPKPLVGVVIFIMLTLLNGVTSGVHGKAAMLMPLLVPLADLLGVSRQIVVLAFIFGDGFTNWFWPTAAIAVASTGAAGIPMERWMKQSWKMFVILSAAAGTLVFISYFIGY